MLTLFKGKTASTKQKSKNNSGSSKARKILSKISGAFMLPISVMAIAGFFLGVGAAIANAGSSNNIEGLKVFGEFIKALGDPIFGALPLLFAAAFVIAFTDEAGVGVFAAIIGYFVFNAIQSVFIWDYMVEETKNVSGTLVGSGTEATVEVKEKTLKGYTILFAAGGRSPETLKALVGYTLGTKSLQTSVFGGLTVGLVVQYLYNRFHQIQLPQVISFFGGKRFVAIVTIPSMIALAFAYLLLWPWIGVALNKFGNALGKVPYGIESFIFGYVERSLVPFGLHHVFYAPLWYSNAGGDLSDALARWQENNPGVVPGDGLIELIAAVAKEPTKFVGDSTASNTLLGQANTVSWTLNGESHTLPLFDFVSNQLGFKIGRFLDGKFSFMIFGLPAAGVAMILAAPKENRKVAIGTVVPSIVTTIVTGVTEPIEFTFLFLSPVLFWGFHAFFCALSFMLANLLGVHIPMTFSGGMLDLLIYWIIPVAKGTHFWWTLVVGLGYIPIYFFGFLFFIKRYNLATPGRGGNTKLFTKADYLANKKGKREDLGEVDPKALEIVLAFGGLDNITTFNNCASRLRYDIKDPALVSEDRLKAAGAAGVKWEGSNHVQAIFGPAADQINSKIKAQRELIRDYLAKNPEFNNNDVVESVKKANEKEHDNQLIDGVVIQTVARGEILTLDRVNDGVFSTKAMGDGFAVKFDAETVGNVYSPVDGEVKLVFPTKHAYGITTKEGVELLIHIGIDTVALNGEGFESFVNVGDHVKAGQQIAKVDLEFLKEKGIQSDAICVVLESGTHKDFSFTNDKMVADSTTTVVGEVK
ncbi:PTS transporter subunit IIABC [Mycoplasmopsis glycophila]|uniref:PTS system, glucose/glucosamine/beta-glucoside-specific, IICBA component n=1 Tax=Mycoplasmopsis glycophila TaxID=171285 RepID=A0A449AVX0_9BACT|nr:PTS transporter subunit IIABC [Mycoplasmopsis glycophila]VEU70764.1 PTS system, glucose/glucosamine/beta-glucoside-specific, IICBA component [Mycoplasmopsis glycophila]